MSDTPFEKRQSGVRPRAHNRTRRLICIGLLTFFLFASGCKDDDSPDDGTFPPVDVWYNDEPSPTSLWWRILIVAGVAGGIWWAARPRYSLKIVVQRGDIKIHCGVPKARTAAIVEFLNGLSLQGKAAILGRRDRNGVLRIAFRGRVDPGTQQRIRNYLKSVL